MKIFLRSNVSIDAVSRGEITGLAYSGSPINEYWGLKNFIVDTESLTVLKNKVALLKDHYAEKVIGHAIASIENYQVIIDGKLSQSVEAAKEVIALANDGFEWELSIGVYDGYLQENFTGEVNGILVENANVLRDGVLREVSVVALGADSNTNATILKEQKFIKENGMKKNLGKLKRVFKLQADADIEEIVEKAEEAIEKIEEIEAEIEEAKEEVAEIEAEVDSRDAEIEKLKERIAELESALDAISEEVDVEERIEEIEEALEEKNIDLSKEKIKDIAKSKETTSIFLSAIKDAKVVRAKIDDKFSKKIRFNGSKNDKTVSLREQANEMVRNGNAKNFTEAISVLARGE